ncbi:Response regulator c-di-GMP phosphodiesterase, RpfG family, contains REC and HD-GYP domains [uncultured Gammaproteobacteria bacterium]
MRGGKVSLVEQFLEFIENTPRQSVHSLCDRVLWKCRALTNTEAGTIFVLRKKGRQREMVAMALQNDVIKTRSDSFVVPVSTESIAGYVATTGKPVLIDDAYTLASEWPFRFNRGFDDATGFRTRSILCFALVGYHGRIIGVVQLINRRGLEPGTVEPFLIEHEQMIAPVNHIVGRAIQLADNVERISQQNVKLRERNSELREERERVVKLQKETEWAFMLSVELLARAAEQHDANTANHILRVNEYSYALARLARQSADFCKDIHVFAALHDVGKMSVDKAVLHKPGRLNAEEQDEMQRHTLYGYNILRTSERLAMAAEIAWSHHEKWDGSGYPRGLKGEEIPLSARIVALADVYDALRSARSYKLGFTHEEAVNIILNGDDRIDPAAHFDPSLLRLFAKYHSDFDQIWQRLGEAAASPDGHGGPPAVIND